jgi:hypothetical protein
MSRELLQQALVHLENACMPAPSFLAEIRAHLAAQPLHEQLREMGEAHAAQPAPVPAESVAWAKQTDKKLRITHMDMHGEEGWRPLVFGDAAPVPADLTMTRDELVAAAESIGMRFPAPAPVPVPLTGHVYLVQYGTKCLEAFADLSAAVAYAYNIGSHAYVACVAVRTPEYVTHVFGIAAPPEVPHVR